MPIPVIAMLVVGFISAVWPGPKLDHKPPKSGGVFAPHMEAPRDMPEVKAPATVAQR